MRSPIRCDAMQFDVVWCDAVRCQMRCDVMRCGTLQHSAVQCNAMRCHAMRCDAMQCRAMRCDEMRCGAVRCGAVQCNAMPCDAMRCDAVQFDAVQGGSGRGDAHRKQRGPKPTPGHCGTNSTAIWAGFSLSGRSVDKEQSGGARATCRHDGRSEPSIHRATERASGRVVAKATVNTEIKRALRVYYSIMDADSSPALPEPSPDPPRPVPMGAGRAHAPSQQGCSRVTRACAHRG